MTEHDQAISMVFNALGDPTRRSLVQRISQGPVSVSNLAKPLNLTLAAVVQHLQVLEECGLVRTEKVGRVRTCRIDSKGLSIAEKWLFERRPLVERQLDSLGKFLSEDE